MKGPFSKNFLIMIDITIWYGRRGALAFGPGLAELFATEQLHLFECFLNSSSGNNGNGNKASKHSIPMQL